jgi:hypothetical protein|tara:strand:+ start:67081 stop:67635 length:555 start_codon:yes stop_codon:yes gene_type:complete
MSCIVNIAGGSVFDPQAPTAEMIDPRGLLHHLAMLSRWGGNVQYPYSVLQHSLLVAANLDEPGDKIYGLLHDLPEALLGSDIVSPTKLLLMRLGADIPAIERQYMLLIYKCLDLPTPSHETSKRVHEADMRARATEVRDVVDNPKGIVCPAPPYTQSIRFMPWDKVLQRGIEALDSYLYFARVA